MDHATHNKIVSFIWSIADDCLRDVFVRGKYRDVILPMFVLRRIDCLLEGTKEAVLEEVRFQKEEAGMTLLDPDGLRAASGHVFYNTSKFTLKSLLGNPSQLQANFNYYLDGFSPNVAEIIAKFDLRNQIRKMSEADALHGVIEKFVAPEINLSPHDTLGPDGRKLPGLTNLGMGYVFEELIRKFNEENNEEAGEHFTPREVIQLMVHLLVEPVKDRLPPVITIYDPACGSGGMLTEAQDYIKDSEGPIQSNSATFLYGKEVNPETYAICKSDMLIKGNNPENIKFGSTLATDEFSDLRFDFMLSNPPYGKSWKTDQGQILEKKGSKTEIIDPRFEVELPDASGEIHTVSAAPAVDDGQLLFLMEMVSKMKRLQDSPLGSRIATVHNGSALFTGNAGGGASNIRQYLIENDLLEAIIQLPNNIFYNTGITTYIWVLSNRKSETRHGKVQLIDASELYQKLRKNLGHKNCAFTSAHIEQITRAYLELADTGKAAVGGLKARVFDNRDFGYWKITVERPLRKSAQFTAERIAALRYDKRLAEEMRWMYEQWGDRVYEAGFLAAKERKDALDDWLEQEEIDRKSADKKKLLNTKFWNGRLALLQAAQSLHLEIGEALTRDFNQFQKQVKKAVKQRGLKLSASQLKQILEAVSWRDPEAVPVLNKMSVFDFEEFCEGGSFNKSTAARYGHFFVNGGYWSYESDSELRDSENVPLNYPGGIDAYFEKEVHPHVEDLPAPRPNPGEFCVYVLKCSDDSFYIGQSDNFPRRLTEHENGQASWTKSRLPVEPLHWEVFTTREEAVAREKELKTGFGRKWLKREHEKNRLAASARQAGAWIDRAKTVVGYEISFNKYFYVHQPLRDLDEVVREIRDLEAETEGLLEQILNFSKE